MLHNHAACGVRPLSYDCGEQQNHHAGLVQLRNLYFTQQESWR